MAYEIEHFLLISELDYPVTWIKLKISRHHNSIYTIYLPETSDHSFEVFDLGYFPFDCHQAIFLCPSISPPD